MLIVSHIFPSLVLSEGEEEDNADHNAKDIAAAAKDDNNDDKNNDGTITPPKVKPVAAAAMKTAVIKPKKDHEIKHLPAPKLPEITNFSINAEDPLNVSYYANSKHNYADVVFRVNRTMGCCEYKVRVAKDGRSILFVRTICARLFDKIILKKIMKDNYNEGSTHIIPWDDTVHEMELKKVHSKNGLFWGMPQVVYLKWKCTGMPIAIGKLDYQTQYRVKIRGEWHVQCNCIVLITVQSAENQVRGELEVKSGYIVLFGVDSSRSQDDPPTLKYALVGERIGGWCSILKARSNILVIALVMKY